MRILLISGLLAATAAVSAADVVTVFPSHDATLYEDTGGLLANGSGPGIFAGRTQSSEARRALVKFDVAAVIPAGSTINSAEIKIYIEQYRGDTAFSFHPVLASWGEGASNAGTPGGTGTTSEAGDATWIHRFYPTTFWSTAGGDFSPTASATGGVSSSPATVTVASTAATVADVQGWLDTPAQNFGWLIRCDETVTSAKRFSSREGANRPRLIIDFTPPATCAVDLNGDGVADFNDYLEFLNLYNTNDLRVDFNADGVVDFNDYLEFLNLYNTGC